MKRTKEHLSYKESLKELGMFGLEKKSSGETLEQPSGT